MRDRDQSSPKYKSFLIRQKYEEKQKKEEERKNRYKQG